jgi:uncharacterized protein (DUF433 family)
MKGANFKPESPLRLDEEGAVRVGNTRVTLDTVFTAFQNGASAEEIVFRYPSLQLPDVYRALAYCLEHVAEVESYMRRRSKTAADLKSRVRASPLASAAWNRLQMLKRGAA